MNSIQYQHVVEAVIRRVAVHLGADGRKGALIAVFTGAPADLKLAAVQIRGLILSGYRIEMVFSSTAKDLYADRLMEMLVGFPHVTPLNETGWPTAVDAAVGVVVPLLSLNTLSRIALLTADTLPANLLLHALFMGVPVIAAQNGVMSGDGYWKTRKGKTPPPAMFSAIKDRFRTFADYGGHIIDIRDLKQTVVKLGSSQISLLDKGKIKVQTAQRRTIHPNSKIITASQVRMAHAAGVDLIIASGAKITPLAREMALSQGVKMFREASRG